MSSSSRARSAAFGVSSEAELRATGIARRLTTPSYPSVGYTGGYDADIAATELRSFGARTVAWWPPAAMYPQLRRATAGDTRDLRLVDATDLVDSHQRPSRARRNAA